MNNGHYNEITEIGLSKSISGLYFKSINHLEREFKKGKELGDPLSIIIKGDSKLVAPLDSASKEDYVTALKVACHFLGADAIMMFSEGSKWTGTEEERQFVMEQMGEIHGHVKSEDILIIMIETQGKHILGHADVRSSKVGKRREIGKIQWCVMDVPDESSVRFSNFLPNKGSTQ
ncbi:hypothetical protein [Burkholderia thailandensis]|nr:hypothetical protein [Burkholderia thailandensis]QIO14907.1 hypothetical protein G9462_23505 [Burkholderia thailandensis]